MKIRATQSDRYAGAHFPRRPATGVLFALACLHLAVGRVQASESSDAVHAAKLFPCLKQHDTDGFRDVVTFASGAKTSGKVLEWADQVLVIDAAGRIEAHPLRNVASIDMRRADATDATPGLADLTVAYIERTPRDASWQGHVTDKNGSPVLDIAPSAAGPAVKPGDEITFHVHILNAGQAPSKPAPCRILIDGREIVPTATIPAVEAGKSHVIAAKWKWLPGQHDLCVEITTAEDADAVRWNNTFEQPTQALAVTMVVARDRYDAFRRHASLVDSFCFEDYAQYLIRNMNALFALSVYPSTPEGVQERVVLDRIVVVDDPMDPRAEPGLIASLRRGGKLEGPAEYAALLRFGRLPEGDDGSKSALLVDWNALKDLGGQLGLTDLSKIETRVDDCLVTDKRGRFAVIEYLSPDRASLMHTPGGFPLTESQAAYLNRSLSAPRGLRGEYLYQMPETTLLRILSNDGRPLPDVEVDVFQRQIEGPDAGRISGVDREQPLVTARSDENGVAPMVNIPVDAKPYPNGFQPPANPFGRIAPDGSNALILLRLRYVQGNWMNEEFHFLPADALNVAFFRGHKKEYVHEIRTRFAPKDASVPPPPFAAVEMWDRSTDHPPLILTWYMPKDVQPELIQEFRVYKRTGFAGQETKPWTLVSIHHPPEQGNFPHGIETYFDEFKYDGPYSLDTFFAVSSVDRNGRESNLSEPGFVPWKKEAIKFAVFGPSGYMTTRGEGEAQFFVWDGYAGTQPNHMATDKFPGYSPASEGIAFLPDGRMVVTDPVNHVLAIYDVSRNQLVDVWPHRSGWPGRPGMKEGEFNDPADVAVDSAGNVYVADRGNHRVQILDSKGAYKGLLDPDFRFRGPHAIAISHDHVCVTDKAGSRCRVYDIKESPAKFVLELPEIADGDRAIVNSRGRVFITGRQSPGGDWTMLSYEPDGAGGAVYSGMGVMPNMGDYERPRSMYHHLSKVEPDWAYMINCFPFDVRRLHLEQP